MLKSNAWIIFFTEIERWDETNQICPFPAHPPPKSYYFLTMCQLSTYLLLLWLMCTLNLSICFSFPSWEFYVYKVRIPVHWELRCLWNVAQNLDIKKPAFWLKSHSWIDMWSLASYQRPVSKFFLMDFICLKETSGRTDVEKCGIAQEEGLTTLAISKHSGLGKVTVLQCWAELERAL